MGANSHVRDSNSIPVCFAAHESLIKDARNYLENIQKRYPQQSVIYYGLMGVGKTALLNTIEETADHMGTLHARIEANEDKEFAARLTCAFNRFLHDISLKAIAEDFTKKCAELIEPFMITYDTGLVSLLFHRMHGEKMPDDSAVEFGPICSTHCVKRAPFHFRYFW